MCLILLCLVLLLFIIAWYLGYRFFIKKEVAIKEVLAASRQTVEAPVNIGCPKCGLRKAKVNTKCKSCGYFF